MSSVHAITEEIIFKARIASFYEFNSEEKISMVEDFGKWLKEKGVKHDFLVWRVQLDIEGKKNG